MQEGSTFLHNEKIINVFTHNKNLDVYVPPLSLFKEECNAQL